MHLLESESILAIKWFKDNKMIVNPGKFQVKKKNNYAQEVKKIGNKVVKVTSSVKRLSIHIDVYTLPIFADLQHIKLTLLRKFLKTKRF